MVSASFAGLLDLVERDQHLGRDLLVQLDVLLELRDHRAAERLELLARSAAVVRQRLGDRPRSSVSVSLKLVISARAAALDQHLHGAVRQLQQLQDRGDGADVIDVVGRRDRPARRSSGRPAGSACRPSSPLPARGRISRGRRTAARSCAGRRRCRAAAGPAAIRRRPDFAGSLRRLRSDARLDRIRHC